jgi:predicted TIM-barrel fold metal-dependent hydrolase
MIIDFHAHVGMGTPGSTDPEQINLPPELTVRGAREAGIDKTVVFPVQYLTHEYPRANEEAAAAVAAYPGELIGFARVNPGNPVALDQVREAVERLGLRGLKLHHACDWFELDSPEVRRLLALCGELRVPALIHTDRDVVAKIIRLAEDVPQTTLVFGHMGIDGKSMRRCLEAAVQLPNVYLETSQTQDTEVLNEAAHRCPDRLLFGTDAVIGPEKHREMAKVRGLACTEAVKAQILGGNAARLLGLEG